jgi:four helix bundle protein
MYRKLNAWQKAYALGISIYKQTRGFPKEELYGITSQMRRAATSIAANIAEGNSRESLKEFKQFLSIARGSASELETWLMFSKDLNYLEESAYQDLAHQLDVVKGLLFGLMKSLA